MILPLLAAATSAAEPVRCTLDDRPVAECRMVDVALPDGSHRLDFTGTGAHVTVVGRAQTGWWSGTLDGRPAMGFERNRGNTVFATRDLTHRFAWWYAADEHGSY